MRKHRIKRAIKFASYKPKMDELKFNDWGVAIDEVYKDKYCNRKAFVIEDGRVLKGKDWSAVMWRGKYGLVQVVDAKKDILYYTFVDQNGNLGQKRFSTYDEKKWARGKIVLQESDTRQIYLWDEEGLQEEFKVKGLPIEEKVKLYSNYTSKVLDVFGGRKLITFQTADKRTVMLDNEDFEVLPLKFGTIGISCNGEHFYTKDGDEEKGIIAIIDNEPKWLFGVTDHMARRIEKYYGEFLNLPVETYGNRDVVSNYLTLAMQSLRNEVAKTQNKDIPELKNKVDKFVVDAAKAIERGVAEFKHQQDFDFEAGRTRAKLEKATGTYERSLLQAYDEKIKE